MIEPTEQELKEYLESLELEEYYKDLEEKQIRYLEEQLYYEENKGNL